MWVLYMSIMFLKEQVTNKPHDQWMPLKWGVGTPGVMDGKDTVSVYLLACDLNHVHVTF